MKQKSGEKANRVPSLLAAGGALFAFPTRAAYLVFPEWAGFFVIIAKVSAVDNEVRLVVKDD